MRYKIRADAKFESVDKCGYDHDHEPPSHTALLNMTPVKNFIYHRPRLSLALLIGGLVGFVIPFQSEAITRALVAWNAGIWTYLLLMAWLMSRANHHQVCEIAQQEDRSGISVLLLMSICAVFSLAAIVWELSAVKDLTAPIRFVHYILTCVTIVGGWCFIAVLFTFHYARLYYTADKNHSPLVFPDQEILPNYWDFLYFSFTIATAAQTSDVIIRSRSMRKTVLAQSVLSFFFNISILGLSINIAASLVNA